MQRVTVQQMVDWMQSAWDTPDDTDLQMKYLVLRMCGYSFGQACDLMQGVKLTDSILVSPKEVSYRPRKR